MKCSNCGGVVRVVDGSYSETYLSELYECANCGQSGTASQNYSTGVRMTAGSIFD